MEILFPLIIYYYTNLSPFGEQDGPQSFEISILGSPEGLYREVKELKN